MARLLGVSFASVNRWEGGRPTGPTADLYQAIEAAIRRGAAPETMHRRLMSVAHFSILYFGWLMPARGGRDDLSDFESSSAQEAMETCISASVMTMENTSSSNISVNTILLMRGGHSLREIRILGRQLRGLVPLLSSDQGDSSPM